MLFEVCKTRLGDRGWRFRSVANRLAPIPWAFVAAFLFIADLGHRRKIRIDSDEMIRESESVVTEGPTEPVRQGSVRVVDKRRVRMPEVAGRAEQDRELDGYQLKRVVARIQNAIDIARQGAYWITGKSGQWADELRCPKDLSPVSLGRQVWRDPLARDMVRGNRSETTKWQSIIDYSLLGGLGDWRASALMWIKKNVTQAEISAHLARELETGKFRAAGEKKRILLLRLVGHAVDALPQNHAEEYLSIALSYSRAKIDPYASNQLVLVSRAVAVSLLAHRPELDKQIANTLLIQSGVKDLTHESYLPVEAKLLAIALRSRAGESGKVIAKLARHVGLTSAQLAAAAGLADAVVDRPPRLRVYRSKARGVSVAGMLVRRILPWTLPPLLCVVGALFVKRLGVSGDPGRMPLGIAESIALLALLLTANVFTVQMSATRFSGQIARLAGQSWTVNFCYSASLVLVCVSLLSQDQVKELAGVAGWASLLAFSGYVCSLLIAVFLLFRRTDPGRAAAGYVEATLPLARASGTKLGKTQAWAITLREALKSVPVVKFSSDAVVGEWSYEITARRGFFLPSRSRMRRLLEHGAFSDGTRLRIVGGLGTIVDRESDVAVLVPSRNQDIKADLIRLAERSFRTWSSVEVEEIATGAVSLTRLMLENARSGDVGTAQAVGHQIVHLMREHVLAARRGRARALSYEALRAEVVNVHKLRPESSSAAATLRARDQEMAPVVPALKAVLSVAVSEYLNNPSDRMDTLDSFIWPLLSMTLEAEAAVGMVVYSVPTNLEKSGSGSHATTELLRQAGVRALELRSRSLFEQVVDRLKDVAKNESARSDAVGIISVLAAIACRFNQVHSIYAVEAFLGILDRLAQTNSTAADTSRFIALWRVGAAGLLAGIPSVAVYVAQRIYGYGLDETLIVMGGSEEYMVSEMGRSNLRGMYLGDNAMDALANYVDFARELSSVFRLPPNSA
ncbi:hypothetical protein SK803_43635 [Lentzea sp. BCCO 10_0856]|uniref:Uncharacterized protein n=1 Tax=Lentzea miocenica TaxID=3095431 RepID=A0ABU4TFZ6_9PSEU|nr:hypothetical protein [Lentzea sp. BCCO 10_0856]MDX8037127.1 hypothetical protein [Lentzea sp. BCCO 10_0856]